MRSRGACHLPAEDRIFADSIFADAAATLRRSLSSNGVTARAHRATGVPENTDNSANTDSFQNCGAEEGSSRKGRSRPSGYSDMFQGTQSAGAVARAGGEILLARPASAPGRVWGSGTRSEPGR